MALPALSPNTPSFSIETESLGTVMAYPLTVRRMRKMKGYDFRKGSEEDFIEILMSSICRQEQSDKSLSVEEIKSLKDSEREDFSEKFIDNNPYIYKENITEVSEGEDGQRVVSSRYGEPKPKNENESNQGYLYRVYKDHETDWREKMAKTFEPYNKTLKDHKSLFSPSFGDSIRSALKSSEQLAETIKRLQPSTNFNLTPDFHTPLPRIESIKPVMDDTNNKLDEVVNHLHGMNELGIQMAETVQNVSDAASKFLLDFGAASDKADKASKRALLLGLLAVIATLLATVFAIVYQEYRNNQDKPLETVTRSIDESSENIIESVNNLSEEQAALLKALNESRDEKNLKTIEAIESLRESVESLNSSIQNMNKNPDEPSQ